MNMNGLLSRAKALYGDLPPPARTIAASAYGYYLRWWRYNSETERLAAEALDREQWTGESWQQWQTERLTKLLNRAATRVPYYRSHWRERRAAGDEADWTDLRNWPILEKDDVRRDPTSFLAEDVAPSRLFRLSTSGTSGKPITTWRSRDTMRRWYALVEARNRMWYGVDRGDPWAILGGQVVAPASQVRPPFWVWNAGLKQLYLSTLHLAPDNADAYVTAMKRHQVRHMYGYASSMHALARMIRERGLAAPQLAVAVSNAEPLLEHQRDLIGKVFGCPVRATYGMSELVAAASECDHGSLHLWPEVGVTEVVDDDSDEAVEDGKSGALVCTGLLNDSMPLVRYRVGDRGALAPADEPACACGRRLPRIDRIEGRTSDNLVTADGRRVFWVNPVFYGMPVVEAQVVQESIGAIHVNVVPDDGYDSESDETIRDRLVERLGDVNVIVRHVGRIPRSENGKFKPVVNLAEAPSEG